MRPAASPRAGDWRDHLPPYGQPAEPPPAPPRQLDSDRPRRHARAGSWFIALGLGAALAVLAIANLQDPRSLGTQLDDAVNQVRGMGGQVGRSVVDSRQAAVQASRQALDGVGTAIDDGAISLKVKTALAADPALSAVRIDVSTQRGVVRLDGPAPDTVARERATVLAGAPQGVRGVDNRLVLPQPARVVTVADGVPRPQAETPAAAPR
ncbi:BON domain-containing protein [Roseateles sp.]|uniref:BON domain-containing protein n=1 Tax=Roseateles sp. TaxID=1971397 RepID=UPI0039EC6DFE